MNGARCDGQAPLACAVNVTHECACRRCASEPDLDERFHHCGDPSCIKRAIEKHERVYGRPAEWRAWP